MRFNKFLRDLKKKEVKSREISKILARFEKKSQIWRDFKNSHEISKSQKSHEISKILARFEKKR